jgi:D-glucosaminate-6-phosphate ammonia-lyase
VVDNLRELGLVPLINAQGPLTRLGGSAVSGEVANAMQWAVQYPVDIPELQAKASCVIASITGAEAGIVTAGASAGLLLGAAACMAGFDAVKMGQLPDTTGMKNEVICARSHRNSYDHALRAAGAKIVEVGVADRLIGTGVRDAEIWEFRGAITEHSAAMFYLAKPDSRPSLPDIVAIAHDAGIPVLVDAAAELPPVANLRRFIEAGADLVVFSGGKAIGGPSASGILCGRRQLVGSALLQQLDLDYQSGEWTPPRNLIATNELQGMPRHGIGRSCKVGKEQIVGLLTALNLFVAVGDDARNRNLSLIAQHIVEHVASLDGIEADIVPDPDMTGMPVVRIRVAGSALTAGGVALALRNGTPRIEVDASRDRQGILILALANLKNDDADVVGRRIREIALTGK